jgi:hypothetical protein
MMKTNRQHIRVCNPRRLAAYSAIQEPPGRTQFSQRSPACWRRRGKAILLLTCLVAVFIGVLPQSHAALTLTAGSGNDIVSPGGTLIIPITVTGFTDLRGVSFTLTWTSGVLSYQSHTAANGLLGGIPSFGGTPSSGTLAFAWVGGSAGAGNGVTLNDNTALFSVTFTGGSTLGPTAINFSSSPTVIQAIAADGSVVPVNTVSDQVTVVPEPINWALGLFACGFVGSATVRWVSSRKMALRVARTVSPGGPGA